MEKNVSIVKVDSRHYRVIARENWGLTREQMRGKHVHHRIAQSDGGTNDPTNLYVCGPWFHDVIWHGGSGGFIEIAAEGGKLGAQKVHQEKNEEGKSLHAIYIAKKSHEKKNEEGKSIHAVEMGTRGAKQTHSKKNEEGKSIQALESLKKIHSRKNEDGKSVHAVKVGNIVHSRGIGCHAPEYKGKGAKVTNSQKWIDPDHPELGERSAPTLASMQKRRGYPHGKENRVRVG
jgi:hypothetical protein